MWYNRADAIATSRNIYALGIDVYASFVVGFDADDEAIFDRQYEFIKQSGIVVATIGLLIALPRTPLYARFERDGRLKSWIGNRHGLWNNLIGTDIAPSLINLEIVESTKYCWNFRERLS